MPSTPNTDYTWKPVSRTRWERPTDEAEQFYTSLAKAHEGTGRTFFAMTGFIALSLPIAAESSRPEIETRMEDALRKAWLQLRYAHPTIASRVEYSRLEGRCKKVYETFSSSCMQEDWLDRTFCVVDEGVTGIEWCNCDPPVPELPTLFLIKTPYRDEGRIRADVVLRAHHDIIDGVGTLMLFDNLLGHAARAYEEQSAYELPRFGGEWVNLSPSLRVAASIPAQMMPAQEERMREVLEFNAGLRRGVEVASVPFKQDSALPGRHQRVAITLAAETTKRLLETCRAARLSITHAYHTAVALCVRDAQDRRPTERMVRYVNYSLINERSRCAEPYSTPAHPAAVYHSVSGRGLAVDLVVPASSDSADVAADSTRRHEFKETAGTIRDFYLGIRDDAEHINLVPAYWAMSTLSYPADGKTPPVPPRNETPSVSISSMGVLDSMIQHRHGDFEVDDPWVTGEELGTGLGLFLGTWKGRLTLSAAYNEAFHEQKEVLEFLQKCNGQTIRGLGVEQQD
ncbi:uncharacterized protein BO97DRAFT_450053 [Aspergillus homomorphus CBS 101889]|uniref:CoA-dependent acyltransferase n=1 Tax=Aspergillus homomorphus (strain CBS 101889) TaxID=1450537 RepID=A0A395I2I1_ASPHC|nr:hypothetical protein BO97DRAFT_450053 [Aspergillus homomorphus CBS 101889]RAL13388.1 hypothetical protein BO97DRAFT_450053 [Aspergillus homomorphus CBS 101889]